MFGAVHDAGVLDRERGSQPAFARTPVARPTGRRRSALGASGTSSGAMECVMPSGTGLGVQRASAEGSRPSNGCASRAQWWKREHAPLASSHRSRARCVPTRALARGSAGRRSPVGGGVAAYVGMAAESPDPSLTALAGRITSQSSSSNHRGGAGISDEVASAVQPLADLPPCAPNPTRDRRDSSRTAEWRATSARAGSPEKEPRR